MNDDDTMLVKLLRLDGYEVVIKPMHSVMGITVHRKDKGCCTGIASGIWVMLELVKQENYFNSYDAIIALIRKQSIETIFKIIFKILGKDSFGIEDLENMIKQTPKQLCVALLQATGNQRAS